MMFFLVITKVLLFSNNNIYIDNYGKIQKEIFIGNLPSDNISINSPLNKSNSFSNNEIPIKFNENKNNKFLRSTVFPINKENFNFSKINNNNSFINYDDNIENNINKKKFISTSRKIKTLYRNIILFSLILFSIANIIIFFVFCCYYSLIKLKLEVYKIANILLISCIFLSFSSIFIPEFPGTAIVYSIYKSYLFINIIYLLRGYKLLYFRTRRKIIKNILIIIFASIESLTTIFLLYTPFFFEMNIYIFCGRNIIENLILFVVGIKIFLKIFINLYRKYRLKRRKRAIATLSYKYKLIIYSKIIIFSFLYCLGFILINIIPIIIDIDDDNDDDNEDDYYYYHSKRHRKIIYFYYINIAIAILFTIIFAIIFFPINNSLLLFIGYNSNIFFITKIKKNKENKMKISKLRKKLIKKCYIKEYPLILLEPFAKTNNILNGSNIHIGITKKIKKKH